MVKKTPLSNIDQAGNTP